MFQIQILRVIKAENRVRRCATREDDKSDVRVRCRMLQVAAAEMHHALQGDLEDPSWPDCHMPHPHD